MSRLIKTNKSLGVISLIPTFILTLILSVLAVGGTANATDVAVDEYSEPSYKVRFYSEEGYLGEESPDAKEITKQVWYEGDNCTLDDLGEGIPEGVRSGYVIAGWKYNDDIYYCVDSLKPSSRDKDIDNLEVPDGEIITVTACWEEVYKITYISNEGYLETASADSKEKIVYKKKSDQYSSWNCPDGKERNGYLIAGWKVEGDDTLYRTNDDFENEKSLNQYELTGDVVFTAQWEKAITITFKSSEGYIDKNEAGSKEKVIRQLAGQRLSYTAPGYVHDNKGLKYWKDTSDGSLYWRGWDKDLDKDSGFEGRGLWSIHPTKDTVFEAVWDTVYKVTYVTAEGTVEYDKKEVTYYAFAGTKLVMLEEPQDNCIPLWGDSKRDGYALSGWVNKADDKRYLPLDDRTGYPDAEEAPLIWDYVVNKDTTFEAMWTPVHKVTFVSDEGGFKNWSEDKTEYSLDELEGCGVYEPEMQRTGYRIIGWKDTSDNKEYFTRYGGEWNPDKTYLRDYVLGDKDVTFEAIWQEAYNLTFTSKEEVKERPGLDKDYTCQVLKGSEVNMAEVDYYSYRPGYALIGWKPDDSDTIYYLSDKYDDDKTGNYIYDYIPKKDTTFYAVWGEAYTIHFVDDKREGGYDDMYVYKNHALGSYWSINKVTGYTPVGWKDKESGILYYCPDGAGFPYYSEDEIPEGAKTNYDLGGIVVTKDMTFVAVWVKDGEKIAQDNDGRVKPGNPANPSGSTDTSKSDTDKNGSAGNNTSNGGNADNSNNGDSGVKPADKTTTGSDTKTPVASNIKTKFSIKNKAKVKATSKIKVTDNDKIKTITLNGRKIKIKKNKASITLKLKSYKKLLKKKGKWNKLVVTDIAGKKVTLKFKIK